MLALITASVAAGIDGLMAAPGLLRTITENFPQRTTGFLTRLSVMNGKSCASHASIPPSSGRTRVIPLACSRSATRALVASLGHEQ